LSRTRRQRCDPEPIRQVILVIGGHRQNNRYENGSWRLSRRLFERFLSDSCVVLFRPCDTDFAALLAELANQTGARQPTLVVAAFSHGVGRGLTSFAAACQARAWTIDAAVLCEPILWGRWWTLLVLYLARTYGGWTPHFPLPAAVSRAVVLFQRRDRPMGHPVTDGQRVILRLELPCGHTECDDHPTYHAIAEALAADPATPADQLMRLAQ